jgi:hypothetical protein
LVPGGQPADCFSLLPASIAVLWWLLLLQDFKDTKDVQRVREELRRLGVTKVLYYKVSSTQALHSMQHQASCSQAF